MPPGYVVRLGQDAARQSRERFGINRPTADLEPFSIRDQMRLRRLADPVAGCRQGGAHERQGASLAVRARNQGTAEGALRMVKASEQGTRSAKAQTNPESPSRLERGQRLGITELLRRQSFVRSSS